VTGRASGIAGSDDRQVAARRAVEALRAGVPSRAAVAALGAAQTEIEDRFTTLLEQVGEGQAQPARPGGLLVGGGFGAGKSHLLEHLTHLAVQAGFVVSRVVVSKETPLHDPAKVFRAAAESAVLPRGYERGSAIAEAASMLDPESAAWAELSRWVSASHSGLNERFAATLLLYGRFAANDGELAEAITRFWSGDPIRVTELRRRLREAGERYPLPAVPARELARQRIRFAARLFAAAGFPGWVVLFDEVELIGRYSVLQRGRSYAELARWVHRDGTTNQGIPLVSVLAMTDDFEAAVVSGKNDREVVPAKFRARQTQEWDETAGRAELGMRIIDREMVLLAPPDSAELDRAYVRLKDLHGEAFGWDPPDVTGLERLAGTRMRQYVRAWINEWDLVRLDPEFTPDTEVAGDAVAAASDYREDSELEGGDGAAN